MKVSLKDIKIHYFKSSGPGGQHKNKRFTGIKVIHQPTGISAVATEQRSQFQNKQLALERLQKKISKLTQKKKRRIPLTLPRKIKQEILESKRKRGQIKRLRQKVREEEW